MKKLLFISILFLLALNVSAQWRGVVRDTISTSTSTDNEIKYLGTSTAGVTTVGSSRKIEQQSILDIIGVITRTSGTPNANLYIQYANVENPNVWSNVDTIAVSGNNPIPFRYTDLNFGNLLVRFEFDAPSSTQVEHYVAEWKVTRKL